MSTTDAARAGGGHVVFISSLGHSGSTLLERALSTHPALVGLGEVHQLLRTLDDRSDVDGHPCGCGERVGDCALWSVAVPELRRTARDEVARYRVVLDIARDVLGPDVALVDSSKSDRALRDLLAAGATVRAVDLTRDVRSWTVAMRDRAARRRADPEHRPRQPADRVRDRIASSPPALFRTWMAMNDARRLSLVSAGMRPVAVGYEPFVGDPGGELARILLSLGLDAAEASIDGDLRLATTHTVFGNNMKLAPELRDRVVADGRWLVRDDWLLPSLLARRTMRANAAWVHAAATPLPFGR